MDFAGIPPEITSGKMYTGPGSGSMVAAAAAWDGLGAELRTAADSYGSVITTLTSGSWRGQSSAMMAAAVAPYVQWMKTTAAQAEHAAGQARLAAAAYEAAFAAVVPPPLIAANRSQLASLVATNILGQNNAAIAATEAQYAEMWAQDAAAMYSYAGQSAAASTVTPFAAAPQTTNPAGVLGQLLTALETTVTSVGSSTQTQFSQLFSAVPSALHSLASIATSPDPTQGMLSALQSFAGMQTLSSISADVELIPKILLPANDALITVIFSFVTSVAKALGAAPAAAAGKAGLGALSAGLGSITHVLGSSGSAVSAVAGHADLVGALSVPPSWAAATPKIQLAVSVLQGTSLPAAPSVDADGSLLGQIALAGWAGSAVGGASARIVTGPPAHVGRPTADNDSLTSERLKRALAEMSQKPESVQHWHTDQANLDNLLGRLSKKPGIHAVHLSTKGTPMPPA